MSVKINVNAIPSGSLTKDKLNSTVQSSLDKADSANELIPAQASSSNQLADKNFVNSSIATSTATFKGTVLASADTEEAAQTALATITGMDSNDYAFVIVLNTPQTGTDKYKRYKYGVSEGSGTWTFEYTLNNSSFTSNQWAAINSGATANKVSNWDTAYGWGNHANAGYLTSITKKMVEDVLTGDIASHSHSAYAPYSHTHTIANITDLQSNLNTIGSALQSLQSQTDSVGSRVMGVEQTLEDTQRRFGFHETDSTIHITASERSNWNAAYTHATTTNANPHQTTFAQLVSKPATISGYGITDAYTKSEVYTKTEVNGKLITTVTLTTSKLTLTRSDGNLEANIPTWNQDTTGNAATATSATLDSASENIASNMTTISTALKSLQSQIDSVATRRCIDEMNASVLSAELFTATNAYLGAVTMATDDSNVGIGTGSPSYKLHVNGAAAGTSWTNTSDIRLKDIIEDINVSLNDIANAPIFKFTWKDKALGEDEELGTSAQYWSDKVPVAVKVKDDTYGLNYQALSLANTVTLAKEVKSLKSENTELRKELDELKEIVSRLTK